MASLSAPRLPSGPKAAGSLALVLLSALTILVLSPQPAVAAASSYYVDKTVAGCSDTGQGSSTTPFCTIAPGLARLQAGDSLFVGDGTYAEMIKPAVSGVASNPVTITRWPGRSPTIAGAGTYGVSIASRSYIVVSNLVVAGSVKDGIFVTGSNNITIQGNTVSGAGQQLQGATANGITLSATSVSSVGGNTTDHNNGHGIAITGSSTADTISDNEASFNAEGWRRNANGIMVTAAGNTVLRNVTHDNEDSGIQFYTGGNNNLAASNVTYNNGDHGIDDLNVTGGRLIGNTVFRNCTTGINVEGTSGNYTIMNNIAVDNAVYPAYAGISCSRRAGNIGIWDSAPPTTVVDHNLVSLSTAGKMYVFQSSYYTLAAMQAATGQEHGGVQADPRFVDPAALDLRITAGSAAIDRGDSGVSGAQGSDIVGNSRVDDPDTANTFASGPRLYDDLGAYEFQPSVPTPLPPVARMSVSPASGSAPLLVSADASASTDPQAQTLAYAFDFGDGTGTGSQAGSTATHTFTAAGSYAVKVTVTNTSGLSSTDTQTVTVSEAAPSPPVARLSVSPASGGAPLLVSADASASTDPQGQTLTYAFDFGDGTGSGNQAGATTTHTYTAAGSYSMTATVTNTSGLSSTQTQTVTVGPTSPPTFVSTVANNYSTSTKTSGYLAVWRTAGVRAGDLVVLTLQLSGTSPTGNIAATDAAGNTYSQSASVSDGAGNRLVVLSGVATSPLAVNDRITVTFPSATSYRLGGDEFTGATRVDTASSAAGSGTAFSSGTAQATVGNEIAFGAVSIPAGSANPSWSSGWRDLGSYAVGGRYLGRAYQLPVSGPQTASGTASGPWLAVVVTLRP